MFVGKRIRLVKDYYVYAGIYKLVASVKDNPNENDRH